VSQLFQNYPDLRADFREWVAEKNAFFEDQTEFTSSVHGTPSNDAKNSSKRKHDTLPSAPSDMLAVPKRKKYIME